MSGIVKRKAAESNIFKANTAANKEHKITHEAPIMMYNGYIVPGDDKKAKELGIRCVDEIKKNIIADFERTAEYCEKNSESEPDLMVHVSTFRIIDGIVYMTYYANTGTDAEDPSKQEARLAFCPLDNPADMTIVRIQKVGDMLDGKKIDALYDTILLYKGGDELYILWTASVDKLYYRFNCTFSISKKELSAIRPNRFKVGEVTNDFSMDGIKEALAFNDIPYKTMFTDIGIMQKLSVRVENGEEYYYTGAYSGYFNCIIKSRDFITWEYVSAPDFINLSLWENATYVIGDKCYYFVRQHECMQGFLTCYDLAEDKWETPCVIRDTQSRSDFVFYNNELYLIHAPIDRDGFGIIRINRENLSQSEVVLVAEMKESMFYPFTDIYGDDAYISYTVDRKHIRLSKFNLKNYIK